MRTALSLPSACARHPPCHCPLHVQGIRPTGGGVLTRGVITGRWYGQMLFGLLRTEAGLHCCMFPAQTCCQLQLRLLLFLGEVPSR